MSSSSVVDKRNLPKAIAKGFNYLDHSISLNDCIKIGNEILNISNKKGYMPLSISIIDTSGKLKYFIREDGCGLLRKDISYGKAFTCLAMGFSSRHLTDNLKNRSNFISSLNNLSNGKMVFAPGGVILLKNNKIVGAVGVSGDTSYIDEYCAIIASQKCGFNTNPKEIHPKYYESKL